MSLHPALARIAASYDQILRDHRDGRLSEADARAQIQMLSTRDDTGVFWMIDPSTGSWLRQTTFGDWVPGTPPESGLAQPTGFQVSGVEDPLAARLRFDRVDESLARPPGSIVGATRHPAVENAGAPRASSWWRGLSGRGRVVAIALALVVLFAGVLVFRTVVAGEGDTTPTPSPSKKGRVKSLSSPVVVSPVGDVRVSRGL